MHGRTVGALGAVLLLAFLAVALIWGKQLLVDAAANAQIRAVQEAFNDGQIDRAQARRMLGDLGAVVDAWPMPPDPESLPAISLGDLRKRQ